jgi:hypothetical protein
MKKTVIAALFALIFSAAGWATNTDAGYKPKTGDASLDVTLGDLNLYTEGDNLSDFVDNASASYNIPRVRVEHLLYDVKMTPADVIMAAIIAKLLGIHLDVVVDKYKANRGKGWGVIAKEMGIKPGSKEFHALKNGAYGELEKVKGKGKKNKGNKGKKNAHKGKKNKNK